MGGRKWTQEENDFLLYCSQNDISWIECAQKLNKTVEAVRSRAYKCNLKNKNAGKRKLRDICLNCEKEECDDCLGEKMGD